MGVSYVSTEFWEADKGTENRLSVRKIVRREDSGNNPVHVTQADTSIHSCGNMGRMLPDLSLFKARNPASYVKCPEF